MSTHQASADKGSRTDITTSDETQHQVERKVGMEIRYDGKCVIMFKAHARNFVGPERFTILLEKPTFPFCASFIERFSRRTTASTSLISFAPWKYFAPQYGRQLISGHSDQMARSIQYSPRFEQQRYLWGISPRSPISHIAKIPLAPQRLGYCSRLPNTQFPPATAHNA